MTNTMTPKPFTPDCGHTVTPVPGSVGTGQATDRDGRTMCYPCAEAHEREAIKTADVYSVYLSERAPHVVTTWTGATLGKVTSHSLGVKKYAKDGPFRLQFVTVQTPDGALWYGRGRDDSEALIIHRKKTP